MEECFLKLNCEGERILFCSMNDCSCILTHFLMIFDRLLCTDIGRNSVIEVGLLTLGKGVMILLLHGLGKVLVRKLQLIILTMQATLR